MSYMLTKSMKTKSKRKDAKKLKNQFYEWEKDWGGNQKEWDHLRSMELPLDPKIATAVIKKLCQSKCIKCDNK